MPSRLLKECYNIANPPVTVVELSATASELEKLEVFDEFSFAPEMKHIAICMDKVTYINSKGCEELVRLHNAVKSRGYRLFVVNPIDNVARVMEEIGCFRILHVVTSIEQVICEAQMLS